MIVFLLLLTKCKNKLLQNIAQFMVFNLDWRFNQVKTFVYSYFSYFALDNLIGRITCMFI